MWLLYRVQMCDYANLRKIDSLRMAFIPDDTLSMPNDDDDSEMR